jgi:hypothetical protein
MGFNDLDRHEDSQSTVFGTINSGQDAAGTDATALNGGTSLNVPLGASVKVRNNSSNGASVFVGDSAVGTGNGYELPVGESVELSVDDVSKLHVVSASGGETVSWIVLHS